MSLFSLSADLHEYPSNSNVRPGPTRFRVLPVSGEMLFVSIVVLLLAGLGCSSPPAVVAPEAALHIALDATQKQRTIEAKSSSLLLLTLPPAERPGYAWQISQHDTRYLRQVSQIVPANRPAEGATVSFLTLSPGRSRLRFVLVPLGSSREVDPIDQQEIIVIIE